MASSTILAIDIIKKHKRVALLPIAVHQTAFLEAMEKSNAFWPTAHTDPTLMAKLAAMSSKLAGFVGVVIPFDITAEASAMGAGVKMGSLTVLPTVIKPITNPSGVTIPTPDTGRLGVIAEATRLLKEQFDNDHPIIESVTGPFTLATLLLGIEKTMYHLFNNSDVLHNLLEITSEFVIAFNKNLIQHGADIIVLLEPVSSLLGPKFFREFSLPYLKYVIKRISAPTILHICGNTNLILKFIKEIAVDGFSFDQKTDLALAVKTLKNHVTLIGNLDPVNLLWKGSIPDIIKETEMIIKMGIDIPSPGCGLPPFISSKNLKAFSDTVRNFNDIFLKESNLKTL